MKIAGIVLIVAGIAAILYGGFSYTDHRRAVDMGPMQIDMTEHHTVPIPPILGIAGILAGGALVYFGIKQGR
jgi:drug/metabolite transporter (DMT)-like permease